MSKSTKSTKTTPTRNPPILIDPPKPSNTKKGEVEEDEEDDESDDGEESDYSDEEEEEPTNINIKPISKTTRKKKGEVEEEESDEEDEPEEEEEELEDDEEINSGDEEEEGVDQDEYDENDDVDADDDDAKLSKTKKAKPAPKKVKEDILDDVADDEEGEDGLVALPETDLDMDELFAEQETFKVGSNKRICKKFVTKYEKVNLLCTRARQLMGGAKPMIKNTAGLTHTEIAKLEFQHKTIPLKIVREIPNSEPEIWLLSELEFNN
jgi:DNA-directed RNA polymerase subunit K/omega